VCWCYVVVWLGWCGISMQAEEILSWCYVVVWLGWYDIRMQAEALFQPAYGYHTTPAIPQRNTNSVVLQPAY